MGVSSFIFYIRFISVFCRFCLPNNSQAHLVSSPTAPTQIWAPSRPSCHGYCHSCLNLPNICSCSLSSWLPHCGQSSFFISKFKLDSLTLCPSVSLQVSLTLSHIPYHTHTHTHTCSKSVDVSIDLPILLEQKHDLIM